MTDKKTEALKLALEALVAIGHEYICQATHHKKKDQHGRFDDCPNAERHQKAITAIREALAEQCVCGEPDTLGTHRTDGPCLAEQPAQPSKPLTDERAKELWDQSRCAIPRYLTFKTLVEAEHGIKG